jgi:hypothetical protein
MKEFQKKQGKYHMMPTKQRDEKGNRIAIK